MDENDILIIRNLLENSRITYRELSEMINISISAIQKRIKKLEEDGVIITYSARPSVIALKCLWILAFGTSTAKSLDLVSKELGRHESVRFVGITGAKFMYVSALLRDISELQEFGSFVSETAHISDIIIGIINVPYLTTPEPLTKIDYRILKPLNRDARKPIADIADDLGLSAKTVRRRLNYMVENNLVTFSIEWMPVYENSFINLFHIYLNEGTDLISTIQKISDKCYPNIAYCFTFSNIPRFFTLTIWTKNAQESHKFQKDLESEGFKNIVPHIFITASWYECWVDQLVRTK
ncbi:MAG: winged helix-turn-helix transcriptional regulator [Candidatus Thorarchaeota archaeon]